MHKHDIAIIGGGAGGLVVVSETAQLDLKVALIEKRATEGWRLPAFWLCAR